MNLLSSVFSVFLNLATTILKLKFLLLLYPYTFSEISGQIINDHQGHDQSNKTSSESLFSVKLRVFEVPGHEFNIRISGEEKFVTNNIGETFPYVEFLGIPYSRPPIEHLRFQRPRMNKPIRDFLAVNYPPMCPQLQGVNGAVIGQEDCLYLNIYAPQESKSNTNPNTNDASKYPVLVWFHGESFEKSADRVFSFLSSGSIRELEPDIFVQHRVLVVTPQYRLGSLGFLSTANEDLNGNMGLFDQLLSLEWVKQFISNFGGDPNQVTVMSQGLSAAAIGLLTTSDLAKGLFHRLILMGGSPLSPLSIDTTPKATFVEIALQNGCPAFPTLRFVRCMQKNSFEDIIKADETLMKGKHIGKSKIPHPVIQRDSDGRFLPPILSRHPSTSFLTGNFEHVPIIIGVSSSEMSGFLPSLAGKDAHEIPTTILSNHKTINQFIRAILTKSRNAELLADLVSFEYFAGLNVSDPAREEQAIDILEEVLSDYIFYVPALNLAKMWSRYAPVYFYVFDYISSASEESEKLFNTTRKRYAEKATGVSSGSGLGLQAYHGSDVQFLMQGHKGSAKDREVGNIFVDFWINFIHKGSPLHSGLDWPQFREGTSKYLRINDQVQISSGFLNRRYNLWNDLFEKVNNHACNPSGSLRRRTNLNYIRLKEAEKLEEPFIQFLTHTRNDDTFYNGKQNLDIDDEFLK